LLKTHIISENKLNPSFIERDLAFFSVKSPFFNSNFREKEILFWAKKSELLS
jgi:hypothetical protein